MTSAQFYSHILVSILLAGTGIVTAQGISSLLNQLFNSQLQNKPLVFVLDKNNVREEQKLPVKPNNLVGASLDRSVEEEIPQGVYLIQSQARPSSPSQKRLPAVNGPGNPSGLGELYDLLANRPKTKVQSGQMAGKGKMLSIQKLLRQSECDATENCIEKCKKRFQGKKKMTCKAKCEMTFECAPASDEPQDYDDPCEDYYNENNC